VAGGVFRGSFSSYREVRNIESRLSHRRERRWISRFRHRVHVCTIVDISTLARRPDESSGRRGEKEKKRGKRKERTRQPRNRPRECSYENPIRPNDTEETIECKIVMGLSESGNLFEGMSSYDRSTLREKWCVELNLNETVHPRWTRAALQRVPFEQGACVLHSFPSSRVQSWIVSRVEPRTPQGA